MSLLWSTSASALPPPVVAAEVNPYPPYTAYVFPGSHYDDISQTITIVDLPATGSYFWQQAFTLNDPSAPRTGGYIGPMQSDGSGTLLFSIWGARGAEPSDAPGSSCRTFDQGGAGWSCRIEPFTLVRDHPYAVSVSRDSEVTADGTWWRGAVMDLATGSTTEIGRILVAPSAAGVRNVVSFAEEFGPHLSSCAAVTRASARWEDPVAQGGTVHPINQISGYGPNDGAPSVGCGTGPTGGSDVVREGGASIHTFRPAAMENDPFAHPTELWGTSGAIGGSNELATHEADEPDLLPRRRGGASVWWTWTAPITGTLDVDLSGSGFDTQLAVFSGGDLGGLARLACDDNSGEGRTSRLARVPVTAGTTYRIAVDGSRGATGPIALSWRAREQVEPGRGRPHGDQRSCGRPHHGR